MLFLENQEYWFQVFRRSRKGQNEQIQLKPFRRAALEELEWKIHLACSNSADFP